MLLERLTVLRADILTGPDKTPFIREENKRVLHIKLYERNKTKMPC